MPTSPDQQGPSLPVLELNRSEEELLHACAIHADAMHTALRAFGPHPAPAPAHETDVASVLLHRLGLSDQVPARFLDVVDMLPACDDCGPAVLARHAALLLRGSGRVVDAALCTTCLHMRQRPGTSVIASVQLLLLAEVSDRVRGLVEAQASPHGIPSPWQRDELDPLWMQHYRACGFGGPDRAGRMSRELFGESVWVTTSASGLLHVDTEYLDRAQSTSSVDNYLVPQDWSEDQVRHLLRQIFPIARETSAYSRLRVDLVACEARLGTTLGVAEIRERIADDAQTLVRGSLRVPTGPSLAADDAQRCARESREAALLQRLVVEHPDSGVHALAGARLTYLQRGAISTAGTARPGAVPWVPWQCPPPVEAATPLTKRRWRQAAGVHDALFSLGASPAERWARALRSRPG